MTPKVVVTGGCGFIGSNLVDELVKKNFEVIVIISMVGSDNANHINVPNRAGEAKNTLADNRKLKSFGWTPKVKLQEWINP